MVERQREIGIRMALGAERGTVVATVIRRTLALTASGIALGMVGASDVTAFAAAAAVLSAVGWSPG